MTEDEEQRFAEGFAHAGQPSRGFALGEMVACDACLRANPPTRTNCLYCGAALPVSEASAALRRPTLKPLEEWERGFNVVLLPNSEATLTGEALVGASALLRVEAERLRAMVEAGVELPLARAASADEAELIVERMRAFGLRVEVFADEVLTAPSLTPRRVRSLDFGEEALVFRAASDGAEERVAWPDLLLFVAGRVYTRRVEVEEQRERLRGRSEIVEAREMTSDEAVLDIYTSRAESAGWRVAAESFDYSCLGARKGLLAAQNFQTLARLLRERAPAARSDDGYARVRHLLQTAWPPAEHTESQGVRRGRGHRLSTEAVTVVGNDAQFTRYSRLRWRLALRGAKES